MMKDNHAAGVHMMMSANHSSGVVHTVMNHAASVGMPSWEAYKPHGMYGATADLKKMAMGKPQSHEPAKAGASMQMNSSEYHQRWSAT